MIDIINKMDDTIKNIDNSDLVKQLKDLKKLMDNDPEIQKLISDFTYAKTKYESDGVITNELTEAKEKLYKNEIVSLYRKLYSELNLSLVKFSKDLTNLLDDKKSNCGKA